VGSRGIGSFRGLIRGAGFRERWCYTEFIVLIVVVVLVAMILLGRRPGSLSGLVVNAVVGVVLLFLTNIVLADDLPINLITIIICAIGGVVGWLIILVLHLLGVAF
jgi:SigmaK-factor processing regulatory protein BofA